MRGETCLDRNELTLMSPLDIARSCRFPGSVSYAEGNYKQGQGQGQGQGQEQAQAQEGTQTHMNKNTNKHKVITRHNRDGDNG
jgi:hypothetical protein